MMDLQNVWTVATKDFSIFGRKKSLNISLVAFPLGMALGLAAVIWLVIRKNTIQIAVLIPLLNAFAFFFIIVASAVPTGMASYSIVGEKVEKSLEPLLATPVTDDEILLGKSFAAFLLSIASTYFGATMFMILIDAISHQKLGYLFYPNWNAGVFLLLTAPLACLFSIEMNVIVSARVNDIRAAQQFGGLMILPFAALYVAGEINFISLDATTLLIISAILLVIDAILFFISRSTFRREEILTKWK